MVTPDNPAGRLLIVLSNARAQSNAEGTNTSQLAGIFGIKVKGKQADKIQQEVVHSLIELLKLIDETQEALSKVVKDPDLFLRPFPHIKGTFIGILGHIDGDWRSYYPNIAKIDFGALEFCADKLSEYPTENLIEQEDLDQITKDIDELFNDVTSSQMPSELRRFILDSLESIRRAIAEYRIRGIERLQEGLGEIVGACIVHYQLMEPEKDKPQVKKLWKVINALKAMIEWGGKAKPLAEPIIKYLWSGDKTPPS